MKTPTH